MDKREVIFGNVSNAVRVRTTSTLKSPKRRSTGSRVGERLELDMDSVGREANFWRFLWSRIFFVVVPTVVVMSGFVVQCE